MFFDLLHLGSGSQAIHYFVLCFVSLLGTIQFVAVRYSAHDLLWINGRVGIVTALLAIILSFAWFLLTDEEIFVPGLAGGEMFSLFFVAVIFSVPITRAIAFVLRSARSLSMTQRNTKRVEDTLA